MIGLDLFELFGMDDARMERNMQMMEGLKRWVSQPSTQDSSHETASNDSEMPIPPSPYTDSCIVSEFANLEIANKDATITKRTFEDHESPSKPWSTGICVVPDDETETLRQFVLDAPRMDVTIDGQPWTGNKNPDQLLSLFFKLLPRWSAVIAAEFCTQTALAPFFCTVRESLEPDTHFVDGGRQAVNLDTRELSMRVEKPFKVVDFDDQMNARTLFVVTLIVNVDLEKGVVEHHFCRSSLVEKDWVYVEELSIEDETAFANGAVAEDIAASAMRMKIGTGPT